MLNVNKQILIKINTISKIMICLINSVKIYTVHSIMNKTILTFLLSVYILETKVILLLTINRAVNNNTNKTLSLET